MLRSSMEANRIGKMLLPTGESKFSRTKANFFSSHLNSHDIDDNHGEFPNKRCAFISDSHARSQNEKYSAQVIEDKEEFKQLCDLCKFVENEDEEKGQFKFDKFKILENFRQDEFNTTLNLVSGMYELPASILKKLYDYKVSDIKQHKQYANDIEAEYKSSIADPSRIAALHEKQIAIKKTGR